jgi:catechol 2,3-dioxygenase-like lactoylglutathione lyase family enzyme
MLGDREVMAFVPTAHPERAMAFYRDALGLELLEDSPFALVFRAGRTMLRVQKVREFTPLPGTALGWRVPDIRAAIETLSGRKVSFERYDGMGQDALGIWTAPGGAKVAWFKDPDGNTLSLTEFTPDQS